jgi:hypothetical protein
VSSPAISKAIYLLIIGSMTIGIAFFSLRSLVNLAKLQGENSGTGRIIRKRVDTNDGAAYFVTYAFEDAAGQTRQREVQLGKANYDSLQEGQLAGVVYEAGNPGNSYLADSRFQRSRLRAMCAWLLLAALMAYIAYSFVTQCVMQDICPT